MKSVIEKIFYCEANRISFNPTKKWMNLDSKRRKIGDELYESLSDSQKKLFIEMSDCEGAQEAETELLHYKEGFKMGLKVAFETFLD
jgi:hypothetical protein